MVMQWELHVVDIEQLLLLMMLLLVVVVVVELWMALRMALWM